MTEHERAAKLYTYQATLDAIERSRHTVSGYKSAVQLQKLKAQASQLRTLLFPSSFQVISK